MYKHSTPPNESSNKPSEETNPKPPSVQEKIHGNPSVPHATGGADAAQLKELLEKNLKWSQIIYEQNRKINHKLLWAAIASWLRFLIIAVPLILAILYLPRLIKEFQCSFLGGTDCPAGQKNGNENLLKLLPLDPAQKEQLKAILK
ncbi:MAG TPA: hypothetical protein VJA27_00070 [Patescibacteria group bacterium]|nr:hypothetical protein [Patescibacteria group bacterium]